MAELQVNGNEAEASEASAAGEQLLSNNSSTEGDQRNIVLTGFGGVRMVKVQKRPIVKPGDGEVLINVKACGLNFIDLMVRQGVIDNPPKAPFTMGFEFSGEIEAIGDNVSQFAVGVYQVNAVSVKLNQEEYPVPIPMFLPSTDGAAFKVGDRVLAVSDFKAWAEHVVVSQNFVFKLPTSMTFEEGAAIFMNYVTAYLLLFELGNLRPNQSVLVHSAGGGVGVAVAQLCKTVENVTVFGTASSVKHDVIQSIVDNVYDHAADYVQEIRKVSPDGVNIVLDCLCGEDTNKGIGILKPLGKYILFGSSNIVTGETKSFFSFAKTWWQMDKISPIKLYDENKTIAGFHLRQLLFRQNGHENIRTIVEALFTLYNAGKIKPIIDSVWPYENVGDAMQRMHDRKNIGKILLDPSLEPKPAVEKTQSTPDSPKENEEDKGDKQDETPK